MSIHETADDRYDVAVLGPWDDEEAGPECADGSMLHLSRMQSQNARLADLALRHRIVIDIGEKTTCNDFLRNIHFTGFYDFRVVNSPVMQRIMCAIQVIPQSLFALVISEIASKARCGDGEILRSLETHFGITFRESKSV